MVILHLSPDDFFNYLKENGCEQCCDEYLNENVIVFKKGEEEIPIQIQKRGYYPRSVCNICDAFNIDPPPDFRKVKNQLDQLKKLKKI